MQLTPTLGVHIALALTATAIGPVVLWARLGRRVRPPLHRAFGYVWVTCLLGVAFTGLVIRDYRLPNIGGYTPIHLLIPVTLLSLCQAFRFLAQGNVRGHRKTMQWLYGLACVATGLLTLLPQRYLGQLVWGQWLGLL